MNKFLQNILLGRKYLHENEVIRRFGTDAEIAAFHRLHKPLWKEVLGNIGNIIGCVVLVGMVVFAFYVVCAYTDYNWVPVK